QSGRQHPGQLWHAAQRTRAVSRTYCGVSHGQSQCALLRTEGMAVYAVGDIQGCLKPLQCLLRKVDFIPSRDTLWAVGVLVNRGPDSLAPLRSLAGLGNALLSALGDQDLHMLAFDQHRSRWR